MKIRALGKYQKAVAVKVNTLINQFLSSLICFQNVYIQSQRFKELDIL